MEVHRECKQKSTKPLDSKRAKQNQSFDYSLGRRRRCSAREVERRLVGDVLTIVHGWTVRTAQVDARCGNTITFGRAFEFDDNVARVSRRRASDIYI